MNYPKLYSIKALDVIEQNYVTEEGVHNTALLTLAAHCINIVAKSMQQESKQFNFYMIREAVVEPKPYPKRRRKTSS